MSKHYDSIVVGAGIIGTSCAAELSRRGQKVLVIDKGLIGKGSSYGNAGWLTPCFSMPLPMPGMFFQSIKWLLDPESPLYIKPSLSPDLAYWMWTFLKNMNETQAQKAIHALVKLSVKSLHMYQELGTKHPEIRFEQKGLLMVGRTQNGLEAIFDEAHRTEPLGVPHRKLNSQEIHDLEPALKGDFLGGVHFTHEAMAEPWQVVAALCRDIRAQGGEVLEETELLSLEQQNGKVSSVTTTHGTFACDNLVIATGSWSKELSKMLDLRIPILGGKGYALIVPKLEKQPTVPVMFLEKKLAITPRENTLRIAGTLELVDQDFSITQRRVDTIIKGARGILHLPEELEIKELWRGLRPCTPDGVPLIGFHGKIPNLMLAMGHQMLGLQSGAGTGFLVADLIMDKRSELNADVFNPNRF